MSDFKIKAGDCLAGGGGITKALKDIQDVDVKWVLNHDKIAIRTNMFNNKGVKHFHADMYKQNEREMLDPEEMAQISTFPKGYFTNKLLKLTRKEQTRLIGNAVPPEWAKIMIEPVINQLKEKLQQRKIAV